MAEWMEAQSAPRDGSHILVTQLGEQGFGICGDKWQDWTAVVHYWSNPGEEGFYLSSGNDADGVIHFTHWMPIGFPASRSSVPEGAGETRLRAAIGKAMRLMEQHLGDTDITHRVEDEQEEPLVAAFQVLVAASRSSVEPPTGEAGDANRPTRNYTGWLIERRENGYAEWLVSLIDEPLRWTREAYEAIRMDTEAETHHEIHRLYKRPGSSRILYATDHQFIVEMPDRARSSSGTPDDVRLVRAWLRLQDGLARQEAEGFDEHNCIAAKNVRDAIDRLTGEKPNGR
jgi:hypothetical protein